MGKLPSNTDESRVRVLKEIYAAKHIIFDPNFTKETKAESWQKIHECAVKNGLYCGSKTWVYARDVLWHNFRKSTSKMLELCEKAGNRDALREIDHLVLDIIGQKDLSIIKRANCKRRRAVRIRSVYRRQSMQNPLATTAVMTVVNSKTHSDTGDVSLIPDVTIKDEPLEVIDIGVVNDNNSGNFDLYNASARSGADSDRHKTIDDILTAGENERTSIRNEAEKQDEKASLESEQVASLKRQLLELQVKNMELLNYKEQLNCLRLEQELGISGSRFTSDLGK